MDTPTTSQHNIFDSEKISQIFLVLLREPRFEPPVFGSPVLVIVSHCFVCSSYRPQRLTPPLVRAGHMFLLWFATNGIPIAATCIGLSLINLTEILEKSSCLGLWVCKSGIFIEAALGIYHRGPLCFEYNLCNKAPCHDNNNI